MWRQFEAWTKLLRHHHKRGKVDIEGVWTADLTPSTKDEWRRAFDTLMNHCFKDSQVALLWATELAEEMAAKARYVQGGKYEAAAARALNRTFEVSNNHRARVLRELEQLMSMYSKLKERPLDEAPASSETKPISQEDLDRDHV